MRHKYPLAFTLLLCFSWLCGCGQASFSESTQAMLDRLPFAVPACFCLDEGESQRTGRLTYRSDSGTVLFLSCTESSPSRLRQESNLTRTVASLQQSFADAGMDAEITDLVRQDGNGLIRYTYTVYLTNSEGATITRKNLTITADYILDLSCGGDVTQKNTIDLDYAALLSAM